MNYIQQDFSVQFSYKVFFTEFLFSLENRLFNDLLESVHEEGIMRKILFVIDENITIHFPKLGEQIDTYFKDNPYVKLVPEKVIVAGGEIAKNEERFLTTIIDAVNEHGIDRHSYIVGIGGGSVLDLTGYAAAISHRGIKLIRVATTVLSQDDSGVGVKNGVNYKGKKNFLGTFVPPFAVFNDYHFLTTLSDRDWVSGISEAIKVALIKDAAFFDWLEQHAEQLANRDKEATQYMIKRCAELHMDHIAGGDPFEFGSSRPLDFGHWSAHKLEQITDFKVLHGEAVAMGIALDTVYSNLVGSLSETETNRVITLLKTIGLPLSHEYMNLTSADDPIFAGLREFQEHLGGRLTIMLLKSIGTGYEVHELDAQLIMKASQILRNAQESPNQQKQPLSC
ncbi:3-dehydroquinate synthase [Albibacterium profundi]|uniref:3-dehydroquinate synthase n=1 Tax=Albibacterium profundi TaxID=3134906 RepID=A0ABV5C9V6_9SPHI